MRVTSETIYSYTLMDILGEAFPDCVASGTHPWNFGTNRMLEDMVNIGFTPTSDERRSIKHLMDDYILPKCWNMKVEVLDEEDKKGYVWLGEFLTWLNSTKERYTTLLNYYSTYKDKLMESVLTTTDSISTSNDTPQDEGNDWGDDLHVSALGKNTTTSKSEGGATYLDQLTMIMRRYKSVYEMWMKEFIKEFRAGGIS